MVKSFNRSAITVFGTEAFLEWVKDTHPNLHRWTLEELNHHPNVYLVEVEDQNCWGNCFEKYFLEIFQNEVGRFIHNGANWPEDITPSLFRHWFRYDYHEDVIDLSLEILEVYDDASDTDT
ncbi:hypothetical protein AM10699_16400 [Acaryochloris marina MBIC10699]|nr:hypothetical protein AM10699_16400 [Acaryochloris marina MBIC10699]